MELVPVGLGGEQLVEHVERPLPGGVLDHPRHFQQMAFRLASTQITSAVELEFCKLGESTGVAVPARLRVAERLEDGTHTGLHQRDAPCLCSLPVRCVLSGNIGEEVGNDTDTKGLA
jgi:hypothetical protein